MNIYKLKLEQTLNECKRHKLRLNSAYSKMSEFMPLTPERYKQLTDDEIEHIDQFLYRFAKLQDAIGLRLFKNVMHFLGETTESKSFIDIFNRLEQLGITDDFENWLKLRTIRNELAHEYDDDPVENAEEINKIYGMKDNLCGYFDKVNNYLDSTDFNN